MTKGKTALYFFLMTGFLWSVSQDLFAQDGKSSKPDINISVNTRIVSTIDLITIKNIELDKARSGDQQINIAPTVHAAAGIMKAEGRPGAEMRISYVQEQELTRTNGSETLTFQYSVSGNTEQNQSTSELLDFNNETTRFNETGEYFFWIGGRVDISNAIPGQYTGDFTIEIEYI